jgi:regulator of cell morphogenesis and NO signaling
MNVIDPPSRPSTPGKADQTPRDWRRASPSDLIEYILNRYHERHREQLPELIALARKVEQAHARHADCPTGLSDLLRDLRQEIESHMRKEEQVLFPMLARGHGKMAEGPITVMRMEHEHHAQALHQLQEVTHGMALPDGACDSWRALYLGLAEFREDLITHINLENDILFAVALRGVVR